MEIHRSFLLKAYSKGKARSGNFGLSKRASQTTGSPKTIVLSLYYNFRLFARPGAYLFYF